MKGRSWKGWRRRNTSSHHESPAASVGWPWSMAPPPFPLVCKEPICSLQGEEVRYRVKSTFSSR